MACADPHAPASMTNRTAGTRVPTTVDDFRGHNRNRSKSRSCLERIGETRLLQRGSRFDHERKKTLAFGRTKRLRELAHQAWLLGGVEAAKSLEEELRAHAAEQEEVLLFDSSHKGADILLRLIRGAPDPVGNAAIEMGGAMKRATDRSNTAKRLMYRQAVLAAAHLTGEQRSVDTCLELEAELLGLERLQ